MGEGETGWRVNNGEGVLEKMWESGWKGVDDDRIGSFHSAKFRYLEILSYFWYFFGTISVTILERVHPFWRVMTKCGCGEKSVDCSYHVYPSTQTRQTWPTLHLFHFHFSFLGLCSSPGVSTFCMERVVGMGETGWRGCTMEKECLERWGRVVGRA